LRALLAASALGLLSSSLHSLSVATVSSCSLTARPAVATIPSVVGSEATVRLALALALPWLGVPPWQCGVHFGLVCLVLSFDGVLSAGFALLFGFGFSFRCVLPREWLVLCCFPVLFNLFLVMATFFLFLGQRNI